MSKKIITKLLNCAVRDKAGRLVITSRPDRFFLDYSRDDGKKQNLSWRRQPETDLLNNWRKLLNIAPGELVAKKYCRIDGGRQKFNFYLTIRPDDNGEKMIIDIAEPSIRIWRLSQLGLQPDDKREIEKIIKMRSGLVLIVSAPENGKSATLQSLLLSLNDPSLNIYLLDNHPTYEVPGVNTMRLDKTSWEKIRRHDSEIVLAENLEEGNNLTEAVLTAATGRLVIGTIQAEDSLAGLRQLLDISLPDSLKLDNLKAIIGQRLMKLKRPARLSGKDKRQVIGLFEILKLTPEFKKQLLMNKSAGRTDKNLRQSAAKVGFKTWESDRQKKIKEGLI